MSRYLVGCAGQHALHNDSGGASPLHHATDDLDDAIAACGSEHAPVGCDIYDRVTRRWIGPTCMEEIEDALARLAERSKT